MLNNESFNLLSGMKLKLKWLGLYEIEVSFVHRMM